MTEDPERTARNRMWGRILIVAMGLLALAQVAPAIWRWFTT